MRNKGCSAAVAAWLFIFLIPCATEGAEVVVRRLDTAPYGCNNSHEDAWFECTATDPLLYWLRIYWNQEDNCQHLCTVPLDGSQPQRMIPVEGFYLNSLSASGRYFLYTANNVTSFGSTTEPYTTFPLADRTGFVYVAPNADLAIYGPSNSSHEECHTECYNNPENEWLDCYEVCHRIYEDFDLYATWFHEPSTAVYLGSVGQPRIMLSANNRWAVISDGPAEGSAGIHMKFSAALDGSGTIPLPGGYPFAITPDSTRCLYRSQESQLCSVAVDQAGMPTVLYQPSDYGELVYACTSPDSKWAIVDISEYPAPADTLVAVSLDATVEPVTLYKGTECEWDETVINHQWCVFRVSHDLYSVSLANLAASGNVAPIRLTTSSQVQRFALAGDTGRVVYQEASDAAASTMYILSVPVDGITPPQQLTPDAVTTTVSGGTLFDHLSISADGHWIAIAGYSVSVFGGPLVQRTSFWVAGPGTWIGDDLVLKSKDTWVDGGVYISERQDGIGVTPEDAVAASGVAGGSIVPETQAYTLTNIGASPVAYTVTSLNETVLFGNASDGATQAVSGTLDAINAAAIGVYLNRNVDPGTYRDVIYFTNVTTGEVVDERRVVLELQGIAVPNVVGLPGADAEQMVSGSGFICEEPIEIYDTEVPAGVVVSQAPAAASVVRLGIGITLTISKGPAPVQIPAVTGMTQAEAVALLNAAGLTAAIIEVHSDAVPAGQVVSMDPPAGQNVPPGTTVTLTISCGVSLTRVPDVVEMPQADAMAAMEAAGLVAVVIETHSDSIPAGQVISMDLPAGQNVPPGTTVTLVVSLGTSPVVVPNVVGLAQADAEAALTAAALAMGSITQAHSDTVHAGNVISQDPTAGITVQKGTPVDMIVSVGPQLAETGSLRVTLNPADVNGEWRVDGGEWQESGAIVTGLAAGVHTVEFAAITDGGFGCAKPYCQWIAPEPQAVTTTAGETIDLVGTYTTAPANAALEELLILAVVLVLFRKGVRS